MGKTFSIIDYDRLVITSINGVPQVEDMQCWRGQVAKYFSAGQDFVTVVDTTNAKSPDQDYRKNEADWMKENKDNVERYCKSSAIIMSNGLLRIVLNAIFWMQAPPMPYKIVANAEEAWDYLLPVMKENGIPEPLSREEFIRVLEGARDSS